MHAVATGTPYYGVVAEFDNSDALQEAAEKAKSEGYTVMDAYTPFPIHGLSESIGFHDEKVPWVYFLLGLAGFITGWALQIYTNVIDYPINVGGKPFLSWPAYFPVAYECTILFAGVGGTIVMLGLNGLPKPYHPVFDAKNFERASQDRFFLAIEASDPEFEVGKVEKFLNSQKPISVSVVIDES